MDGSEITQDMCESAQRRVLLSRASPEPATRTSGVLPILFADPIAGGTSCLIHVQAASACTSVSPFSLLVEEHIPCHGACGPPG